MLHREKKDWSRKNVVYSIQTRLKFATGIITQLQNRVAFIALLLILPNVHSAVAHRKKLKTFLRHWLQTLCS